MAEQPYLTLDEAAEALGVTVATLREQVRRGVLKTVRFGQRQHLVTPAEVERYRAEHKGRRLKGAGKRQGGAR